MALLADEILIIKEAIDTNTEFFIAGKGSFRGQIGRITEIAGKCAFAGKA
jgi:hypothetical protein